MFFLAVSIVLQICINRGMFASKNYSFFSLLCRQHAVALSKELRLYELRNWEPCCPWQTGWTSRLLRTLLISFLSLITQIFFGRVTLHLQPLANCYLVSLPLKGMASYFDSNKYLHVLNNTLMLMLLQKQLSPLLYLLYRQLPSRLHFTEFSIFESQMQRC